MAISRTDAIKSLRPSAANRATSKIAPSRPTPIRKFVGNNMMPSVLERKKNNAKSPSDTNARGKTILDGDHWGKDLQRQCHCLDHSDRRDCSRLTSPPCVQHEVKRSFSLREIEESRLI